MSSIRTAALCFALALLVGCGTPNIKEDYRLSPDNGTGLVIGSVTYSGLLSEYRITYRQLPKGVSGYFTAGSSQYPVFGSDTDFPEGVTGRLFSAALPPGRYAFSGWGISSGAANSRSIDPMQIEFTVKAGQPLYVGNFFFVPSRRLGFTAIGAKVFHNLHTDRDLAVFKRKYPQVQLSDLEILEPLTAPNQPLGQNVETHFTMPVPIVPR